MDVLVSQHFIGDPVEDVEYQEAQGKNGPGYGVNALGPVHKTLVKYLSVTHGNWRRGVEHSGSLYSGTILGLQAVTHSITPEVKTTALSDQFLLLWSQAYGEKRLAFCCRLKLTCNFLYFLTCLGCTCEKRAAERNGKSMATTVSYI